MSSSTETPSLEGEQNLSSKYVEILKNNGITEPVSMVIVKDSVLTGQGFGSQQLYVTVKFENPEVPDLHLFGKALTSNSSHTKMITEAKSFEKEARFFMEYIPAAEKLCKAKGQQDLLDIYPKCYYGDDKLIILENLVLDKGYIVQNKEDKQNLEEAKSALSTLAKHHAISYAMIKNHGGAERFFETYKDLNFDPYTNPCIREMMKPMITNSVNNSIKLLEKYPVKERDEALEKLQTEGASAFEITMNNLELDKEDDTPLVLGHGDYHGNNMMFLREPETQKILHLKVIDLQVVRYNGTAIDVSYYLYTSVKPEVRRGHLKELLKFYLDNFNKTCSDLGHPIEYSFEDFFLHYRKKFKHGFWIGFIHVGPLFAIMKDVNVGEMENPNDFPALINKATEKWINENPDKGENIAKQIVGVVEEYYELNLDN